MIIRKATPKDAERIAEGYIEMIKTHSSLGKFFLPAWAPKTIKNYSQLIKSKDLKKQAFKDAIETIKDKNTFTFVAEENGEFLGYSYFFIEENNKWFGVKKYGFLDEVCVLEKFRGQGVASKLLKFSEDFLKKKGIKFIMLKTIIQNYLAQRVWESKGYKKEMFVHVKELK
jgi:ribosomal protein S18 acetylase RimI-like enzyme